ncbi:hypothetical protein BDV41DRAFT_572610 [Aspergillus transmontanensis]|uniref:Uncharacterized protein n=1 Tax=Aspergillus transmontanensis TaxID=1034304 RepID=A0A5N6WA40_9EURO|nr:hypothetical protein BDV41DRAFT_572610 [Aspergillus transmontanensis]
MSTILLILCLYTITTLFNPGWAQTNHKTPKNLCSTPGTHYCMHGSLQSPEMLSCVSRTKAELRSCNIELARIIPKGNEGWALCYETSPDSGDAICAFNGTGYTRMRGTVEVPGTRICEDDSGSIDDLERMDVVSLEKGVSSTMGSSQSYGLGSGSSHAITSSLSVALGSFRPVTVSVAGEMGEPVQRKRERWFCFDRGRSRSVDPGDRVVVTVFSSGSSWGSSVVRSHETTVDSDGVDVSGLGMGLGSTRALGSTYVATSTGSLATLDGTSTVGFPVATGSVDGVGALGVRGVWYVSGLFVVWALGWAW